jgi:hypothetical protein
MERIAPASSVIPPPGTTSKWNMGVLVLDAPVPIFNVPDITGMVDKAQK